MALGRSGRTTVATMHAKDVGCYRESSEICVRGDGKALERFDVSRSPSGDAYVADLPAHEAASNAGTRVAAERRLPRAIGSLGERGAFAGPGMR